jgi:hypothetical protein
VTGTNFVVLSGGNGGAAGNATATGGRGADGVANCPDGGHGGDAQLGDLLGNPFGTGGRGGRVIWQGGKGGDGYDDPCSVPTVLPGGKGGVGGTVAGSVGFGGDGKVPGADGDAVFNQVANGGDGGNGHPRGTKGVGGDNITLSRVGGPVSFQPGLDGWQCDHYAVTLTVAPGPFGDPNGLDAILNVTKVTDIVWVHQVFAQPQALIRGFPVDLTRTNAGPDPQGLFYVNGPVAFTFNEASQHGDFEFSGRVLGETLTGPNANTPYFTVEIWPAGNSTFQHATFRGTGTLKVP